MPSVWIGPEFHDQDKGDGGIRRVVEAQLRHLPALGWAIAPRPEEADVVCSHASAQTDPNLDKPWVAANHGLYWDAELDFGRWSEPANAQVRDNLHRADVVTCPSEWVAVALRRGMLLDPLVIPHGIDPEDWPAGEPGSPRYALWNKARVDVVCDPREVGTLAKLRPSTRFVSTFGDPLPNVRITGRVPYPEMREMVSSAAVYLCLARETFGIGTLEAMASGVPVLGWAWGGQVDIVRHKEHGWLAPPGDYDDLARGLDWCLRNRARLGRAARAHVLEHYTWPAVMGGYAEAFQRALRTRPDSDAPLVTVVVTAYKLARYLPACLDSIAAQDFTAWECVVVDDASPDETADIVATYAGRDPRFRLIRNPRNVYLAEARNVGYRAARGRFVLPLDADDQVSPGALRVLVEALLRDRSIDVAYGAMEWFPDGEPQKVQRSEGWPLPFRMEHQMGRRNQLPYSALMREEVWRRVGGYRRHIRTAEDADFWCRIASYGFRPAKVTDRPCLRKCERADSMGRVEPVSRDWTDWFPWARRPELSPFGILTSSDVDSRRSCARVRSHAEPVVSVVVPVGPGHQEAAIKAVDSVVAQTYADWEVVAANDTGAPLSLPGLPFVRIVEVGPAHGPAAARNAGARVARGRYVVFLDADDWLHPEFLEHCLDVLRQGSTGAREYVYTDARLVEGPTVEHYQPGELQPSDHLRQSQHAVTTLLPRAAWEAVGGFDESLDGWEDWDFYVALATACWCGVYLPEELVAYDKLAGHRRDDSLAVRQPLLERFKAKYRDYYEGARTMACGSCGRSRGAPAATPPPAPPQTVATAQSVPGAGPEAPTVDAMRLALYRHPNRGPHTVRGLATGTRYGRRAGGETFMVHPADVAAAPNLFEWVKS